MPNYFRDLFNSKTVVAGSEETLFSERWIGFPGECYALGIGVQDPNLWSASTFQVLINGVPVLDYGKIQDRIGSLDLMTPVKIDLPANCLIEMTAANGSGSDSLYAGRLQCRAK